MKRELRFQVSHLLTAGACCVVLFLLPISPLAAQGPSGGQGYQVPPPEMVALVDAAPTPGVSLDPS